MDLKLDFQGHKPQKNYNPISNINDSRQKPFNVILPIPVLLDVLKNYCYLSNWDTDPILLLKRLKVFLLKKYITCYIYVYVLY